MKRSTMSDTMRTTSLRLLATTLALAAGVAATSPAQAAAYATGGSGQYRDEILWLTWGGGTNGTNGQPLVNGSNTSATIAVTDTLTLQVDCTLADITGGTAGSGLVSYRPGNYSGDPLDDLYNIGGTGTANQLATGIYTVVQDQAKNFVVNCASTLGGQPYRIPGLVMADAESLEAGGTPANPDEYLQGTADGTWNVVEMLRVAGRTYYGTKTDGGTLQTLRFGPGGQGSGTSPGAITFLTFDPSAYQGPGQTISMAFTVLGGGRTAIAIGLLVPRADFGDAPASHGEPSHLLASLVAAPDGLPADGVARDINDTGFQLGALQPPSTGFIGSTGPDGEQSAQHGAGATGDDASGSAGGDEEDGWPAGFTLATNEAGGTLAQAVACNGSGTVAGWIDFDRDGSFAAGERAAAACSGGSAALAWTLPAVLEPGTTYVRLRYASTAAQVVDAVAEAADGEVEDHAMAIVAPVADLRIEKTNPATELESGDTTTYTITVSNDGPSAADGAVVSDDWTATPGLDCSAGPLTCAASGTAGTQCPAAVTPAQLQAGIAIPALPLGGVVTFSLACEVTASGE
jgi:hypothetical protein